MSAVNCVGQRFQPVSISPNESRFGDTPNGLDRPPKTSCFRKPEQARRLSCGMVPGQESLFVCVYLLSTSPVLSHDIVPVCEDFPGARLSRPQRVEAEKMTSKNQMPLANRGCCA
jgi:hypothetical protein